MQSLSELLERAVDQAAGRRAYTFLAQGRDEARVLTYGDLHRLAGQCAHRLRERVAPGERVLLLHENSLDFLIGFLACGFARVVAVPIPPPDASRLKRTLPRMRSVVADCQAAAMMTSGRIRDLLAATFAGDAGLRELPWVVTDDGADDMSHDRLPPERVASGDLALLQYTSGSTSAPKGVMVTHANLLDNLGRLQQSFEYGPESTTVTWMPYFHDYGLIDGLLEPLYAMATCYVISPVAFIKRPWCWLDAVSRYRATHIHAPTFAYQLCAERAADHEYAGLDLSSLRVAGCAAEPVRRETAEQFIATFAPFGFRPEAFAPAYGLAEATLVVSAKPTGARHRTAVLSAEDLERGRAIDAAPDAPRARAVLSCGRPAGGFPFAIVDADTTRECGTDEIGEIWLSGPSVAAGYWQRPAETAEIFGATTASGRGPMLRTGDLGFTRDGEIYVTGRLKDLLIVNGANHYPHDIEQTVEAADAAIRSTCVAAFPVDREAGEGLVVAAEIGRRDADLTAVMSAIRSAVALEHEVACDGIVLLPKGSILKTSSGKIQRRACRDAYLNGDFQPLAEWRRPEGGGAGAATEWEARLCRLVARRLRLRDDQVDPAEPFASFGLTSVDAVEIAAAIEDHARTPVAATTLWEYPSIRALAAFLSTGEPVAGVPRHASPQPDVVVEDDLIAVVGMGCEFPGDSHSPAAFWATLTSGRDAIVGAPEGRFANGARGKSAGYLRDLFRFDADFFGVSDREAASLDPQQRLLLQTAWHALEDAALVPASLAGSDAGVFIGVSATDYAQEVYGAASGVDRFAATGTSAAVLSNRLSYFLDARGPSLTIDTACSASLVAVHQACQALNAGDCGLAIAGGVNAMLSAGAEAALERAQMLSPSGRCRPFDADADGYVRGEGCGIVVLKTLAAARRDGNRVLAVIRGSAVVQDGRSNGLSAPNGAAQREAVRRALARARIEPESVEYVEAHGTGTPLGDPIELRALADCYGRSGATPCVVGAVKATIGHLEGAAGIAGLIKTILILRHGVIPATAHLRTPTAHADLSGTRLTLSMSATAWPVREHPRVAAVSSFGFGGTLAHVILSDGPQDLRSSRAPANADDPKVLVLSARDRTALRALASRYAQLCEQSSADLAGLCASAATMRAALPDRVTFAFTSKADLLSRLTAFSVSGERDAPPATVPAFSPPRPADAWDLPLYPFGGREHRVGGARPRIPQTYVTEWGAVEPGAAVEASTPVRPCVLAGDPVVPGSRLAAAIDRCAALRRVETVARDGTNAAVPLVIFHGSARASEAPDETALRLGAELIATLRTLAAAKEQAEMWVVTEGAMPVMSDDPVQLEGACLWGIGRSAALELPELWGGLVDLPAGFSDADADRAMRAVARARHGALEDQRALRGGRWFAPRLVAAPPPGEPERAPQFRADAVYWVAGGAGALGQHVVRALVDGGARHILVTARRDIVLPSPAGADVHAVRADVRSVEDCARVLAHIDGTGLPLAGIVHAAGVANECPIERLGADQFRDVATAKVTGAWNLHTLTLDRRLDFFIGFSSIASLWGSAAQAHYAAGNHFLDMLCEHRRALGQPGLAIAWGPWGGGGMVTPDVQARLVRTGLDLLEPAAAMALFRTLHASRRHARIAGVNVRWDVFGATFTARRPSAFLSRFVAIEEQAPEAGRAIASELEPLTAGQLRTRVRDYLRRAVADALGAGRVPEMDRGFFDLGLDSLAIVTIRRQLEADFGVAVSSADMFNYPTIHALTDRIVEVWRPARGAGAPDAQDRDPSAMSQAELIRRISLEFDALGHPAE